MAAGVWAPQASVVRLGDSLEIGSMALKRMDNIGIAVVAEYLREDRVVAEKKRKVQQPTKRPPTPSQRTCCRSCIRCRPLA
jgi:hypothetical protein